MTNCITCGQKHNLNQDECGGCFRARLLSQTVDMSGIRTDLKSMSAVGKLTDDKISELCETRAGKVLLDKRADELYQGKKHLARVHGEGMYDIKKSNGDLVKGVGEVEKDLSK